VKELTARDGALPNAALTDVAHSGGAYVREASGGNNNDHDRRPQHLVPDPANDATPQAQATMHLHPSATVHPHLPAGFFEESDGTRSSMRLMCFTALIAAVVFGLLSVLAAIGLIGAGTLAGIGGEVVTITFGFLVAAFAPKAVQKFAE
jgi:hypothetical protein